MATNGWFAPTVLASFAELHLVDAPPSFHRTAGFRYRHGSITSINKCWKYKNNGTTLSNNVESCESTSTGYESATDAEYAKDKAYESCTKKAGAFSYSETLKTSIKSGETMKYEYYCQINS